MSSQNEAGAKSKFKYYKQWDTQDVSDWLTNNLKLPQYGKQFEEIGVDGQIIEFVTDSDLEKDFGIKLRLHRVKIIEGIKKLQLEDNQLSQSNIPS